METKEQILHLLLQKGFKFRFYEDQNLLFYTKEITEPVFVKWFAEEHCHLPDCDMTHVSISLKSRIISNVRNILSLMALINNIYLKTY